MYKAIKNPSSHWLAVFLCVQLTGLPSLAVAAEGVLSLPKVGTMVPVSSKYNPTLIKGIKIYPDNPFRFDFIVDKGDSGLEGEALKAESLKLIKYFMASLAVPEDDLWVNLSPYEKDRIIPDGFSQTDMGKDLLAQDYILKQLAATLVYPEDALGEQYWKKVRAAAGGDISIDEKTFQKVWIVPDQTTVYENDDTAFILDSTLKVMQEQDYLSMKADQGDSSAQDQLVKDTTGLNEASLRILKEMIIPKIESDVNEGKNFASLRQIYSSLILATWFKRNLRKNLFAQVYVDREKMAGIALEEKEIKEKIYQQYLASFKKGVYDYIKEEYDAKSDEMIPRKYFSGGVKFQITGAGFNQVGVGSSAVTQALPELLARLQKMATISAVVSCVGVCTGIPQNSEAQTVQSPIKAEVVDPAAPYRQALAAPMFDPLSTIIQEGRDSKTANSDADEYYAKIGDLIKKLRTGNAGVPNFIGVLKENAEKIKTAVAKKAFKDEAGSAKDVARHAALETEIERLSSTFFMIGTYDNKKPTIIFVPGSDSTGLIEPFYKLVHSFEKYNVAVSFHDSNTPEPAVEQFSRALTDFQLQYKPEKVVLMPNGSSWWHTMMGYDRFNRVNPQEARTWRAYVFSLNSWVAGDLKTAFLSIPEREKSENPFQYYGPKELLVRRAVANSKFAGSEHVAIIDDRSTDTKWLTPAKRENYTKIVDRLIKGAKKLFDFKAEPLLSFGSVNRYADDNLIRYSLTRLQAMLDQAVPSQPESITDESPAAPEGATLKDVPIPVPATPASGAASTTLNSADPASVGGIDLTAKNLNIAARGKGINIPDTTVWGGLENIQIDGFSPEIFQIAPVTDLPQMLGIQNTPAIPVSR